MTFLGVTEHFSGKNGALRWSILVGKQKHNVQRPTVTVCYRILNGGSETPHQNYFQLNNMRTAEESDVWISCIRCVLVILSFSNRFSMKTGVV